MACQGCGLTSQSRLCCPTCVEYGRQSFFCSQECFTKNWKSHNQLHEILKRKKELADSAGGGPSENGGNVSPKERRVRPSAPPAPPPPRAEEKSAPSRTYSPLPGGSLFAGRTGAPSLQAKGGSSSSSSTAPANASSGGAESMVDKMWAMLGSASESAWTSNKSDAQRSGGPARRNASRDRHGVQREPPPSPAPKSATAAAGLAFAKGSQSGMVRWGIGVLTVVSLIWGVLYYRAHSHYTDESNAAIEFVSMAPAVVETPPPSAVVEGPALPQTSLDTSDISALRSEVASLKELVLRHDKMLRYVMDRYVEKSPQASEDSPLPSGGGLGPGAVASTAHDASAAAEGLGEVHLEASAAVAAKDAVRKRRSGGEAAIGAIPDGEEAAVVPPAPSDAGAVATMPAAEDASSGFGVGAVEFESKNNQLGI